MKLSNIKKIRGQGMSEYLILVALVAVAAIAAVGLFGTTARSQLASVSQELAGNSGAGANGQADAEAQAAQDDGDERRGMGEFQGAQQTSGFGQ